jgi:ATP-dependent helicase HepA
VLVVVPEHLAFQWLAELFHKFNALFTLLTPSRLAELGGPEAALTRSPLAIVSFEALLADPALAAAAAAQPLDLVIVDEAHHLADDALHQLVAPLCRRSFGALLLTATPVRLDPREYFRLLSLVEPIPSTDEKGFLARLEQAEAYATVARELLGGAPVAAARKRLRKLSPDDATFEDDELTADDLLAHLADRYSLSARLIRNRRVKVGAFTARQLQRFDVPAGGRMKALVELCAGLARAGEKVLVFGSDPGSLAELQVGVAGAGFEALSYDQALTLESRDRLVARFRDPEGPRLLLSGEAGGEGRNFQFAAHLVCADLPESPLVLEQRIGRLDRLGQTRPVQIHLVVEPGEEQFLADLYQHEIGIFEEPVGGLDALLASLPAELAALRKKKTAKARADFRARLAGRVAEARRVQHEGDPLLDIRSASLPELAALVGNAFARLDEEPPQGIASLHGVPTEAGMEAVREALVTLSRWLEEELEDLGTDIGRRVGLDVDTDQNVSPFEVAFTIGSGLRVEALPGMAMPEEPETFLGSFWRETAVQRDELEWFATGHRLVEALIGLARDGEAGRSAVMRRTWAPRRGGLAIRFTLQWATDADTTPGARVGSRQASRYLDGDPITVLVDLEAHRVITGGGDRLEAEADEADDIRVGAVPPALLERARDAAQAEAESRLRKRKEKALARLDAHATGEEQRLVEAAFAGSTGKKSVEAALAAVRQHLKVTSAALERVSLALDAAAVIVP